MELLIRLLFIIIVLGINFALIVLPKFPFLKNYETEVTVLIPFICLVFFDYYQNLFKNYNTKIFKKDILKRENNFVFPFEIHYYGKQITKFYITGLSSNIGFTASLISKPDDIKLTPVEIYEKNLTNTENSLKFELIIQLKNVNDINIYDIPTLIKFVKRGDQFIRFNFLIGNRKVTLKYRLCLQKENQT